jgi:hypothetical protein
MSTKNIHNTFICQPYGLIKIIDENSKWVDVTKPNGETFQILKEIIDRQMVTNNVIKNTIKNAERKALRGDKSIPIRSPTPTNE